MKADGIQTVPPANVPNMRLRNFTHAQNTKANFRKMHTNTKHPIHKSNVLSSVEVEALVTVVWRETIESLPDSADIFVPPDTPDSADLVLPGVDTLPSPHRPSVWACCGVCEGVCTGCFCKLPTFGTSCCALFEALDCESW